MISSDIAEEHAKGDVAPDPDASQNAKDGAYLLSLVKARISSTTCSGYAQAAQATYRDPPVYTQACCHFWFKVNHYCLIT